MITTPMLTQKMVMKILIVLPAPVNDSRTQLIKGIVGAEPIAPLATMLAVDIALM
jgi:hypothetical protein